MSLVVSGRKYVPPPEGLRQAVCVDVVDLGIVETQFGKKDKAKIVWELDAEMDDGRAFLISRKYTKSLHEKATLHKDLKAWRGRAFTTEELASFDLENVLGAPCQILIQHEEKDGTVYGNISALLKAEKGFGLKPSGRYVRVKDRPEQTNGGGNGNGSQSDDDNENPPF